MTDELIEAIKADRETGTPGPWVRGGLLSHTSSFDFYDPFGPHGESVACVSGDRQGEADETDVVNARRIARVPDMEARILSDAKKIEAAEEHLVAALNMAISGYSRPDISHEEFRVQITRAAEAALGEWDAAQ